MLSLRSKTAQTYIEVWLLYVLEEDGDRVLAWLSVIDIAHAVRSQIGLPILILWNLEFAARKHQSSSTCRVRYDGNIPLIQSHSILHEQ